MNIHDTILDFSDCIMDTESWILDPDSRLPLFMFIDEQVTF
jgi:hypothetical protein